MSTVQSSPEYTVPAGYSDAMMFWYGVPPIVVAPGANVPGQLLVQSDSDFEWRGTSWFVTSSAGGQPYTDAGDLVPSMLLEVVPQGQQRPFSNGQVALDTIAGRGRLVYVLPYPIILLRGNGVTFNLNNLESANTYTIYLTLHGRKLFA
ncbi:MAG: hypothetical protein ACYCUI_11600 [Vulcanimicrobiaceae bacterium]